MVGLTLLKAAHAAGLAVRADGSRLVVRGPRRAEPLAKQLLENKAEVLDVLADGGSASGRRHSVADTSDRPTATTRPGWIDTEPPDHERIVNGITVPAGWTVASWADRLNYLSNVCVDLARARELRTMVRRIEESATGHHGIDATAMLRRDAAVAIGRIKSRSKRKALVWRRAVGGAS